jgi:Flp pilus assembly protein TadB
MMDKDSISPTTESEEAPSPRAQIAGLVSDVRMLAEAEWNYARARLSYSGNIVRMAGIYALFAILSLSAAAIGLVVGLLLITASYFGPWVATLIVVLVFGLAAWILALRARKTARALNFDESDD